MASKLAPLRKRSLDPANNLMGQGYRLIAGIDEVGRGCLAGPVVAAAVILPFPYTIDGIRDSKKLTDIRRRALSQQIKEVAIGYAIAEVEVEKIDSIGIQKSCQLAMAKAIKELSPQPEYLLIDGNITIPSQLPQQSIIKGDDLSIVIGAASIIAKVYRDDLMIKLDSEFPQFGFKEHKGYGTEFHCSAIRIHGPSSLHRKTFARVKEYVS